MTDNASLQDTGTRVLKNNLFLGTVGFLYGEYDIAHNAFISQSPTVVTNSIPGVPISVVGQSAWLNTLSDNLVVNNASPTSGSGWLPGNMSRTVTLNLANGTDCDTFRGVEPSGLRYSFTVDGLTDEAWQGSAPAGGCDKVRGASLIPSWSDQNSSSVDISLRNIVAVPRANGAGPYSGYPAHDTLIANETSGSASGNIHYHISNVVTPACASIHCGILDFEANNGAPGQIAEMANSITYSIGAPSSNARIVLDVGAVLAPGTIALADYNNHWNTSNTGQTLYDYAPTAYQNWAAVGSHDRNLDPQFVDITRNMLTWAAAAPRNSTETYQSIQAHWTAYQTTAWDSNWDWSNFAFGGAPTPNCAPNCYFDWITAGFMSTNSALKGTGYGGFDIGLMASPPILARKSGPSGEHGKSDAGLLAGAPNAGSLHRNREPQKPTAAVAER